MYKVAAERYNLAGETSKSRSYAAVSFETSIAVGEQSGSVALTLEDDLHTPIPVGSGASDYQYVREFNPDGTLCESMTLKDGRVLRSGGQTADRP
jgi:hypothetical protein